MYMCVIAHTSITRLEEEGTVNQKLLSERSTADSKIKTLEEQMTLSEDNISKVSGLVKTPNPFGHTAREKDIFKNFVKTTKLTQIKKEELLDHYVYIISSLFCVADLIGFLGVNDGKATPSNVLFTKFIKNLTVGGDLENVFGINSRRNIRGDDREKMFIQILTDYVTTVASSNDAKNIIQITTNCKTLYELCVQKVADGGSTVLDSKITYINSFFRCDALKSNKKNVTNSIFKIILIKQQRQNE